MKVDNDQDAVEDVILQFRFQTEQRHPGVFTGFVGNLLGIPPITALDGPGSEGLGSRQSYTVTAIRGNQQFDLSGGRKLFAVPSNVGPRTMPNYQALYDQGIYDLGNGIRVFAGTTDDPFYIDLGAAFDSLNFRPEAGGGVLSQADDANNAVNVAADDVSGFNVNTIAIEIPIRFLTRDLQTHTDAEPAAVLGTYGTTSRPQVTVRRRPREGRGNLPPRRSGRCSAWATRSSTSSSSAPGRRIASAWTIRQRRPVRDLLRPAAARRHLQIDRRAGAGRPPHRPGAAAAYTGPTIPAATRKGPVADLLRVNTGIPATPAAQQQRLGLLTLLDGNGANDDAAGFPNGRRPDDDVTDIAARAVAGILVNPATFGTRIGDGVNINDMPKRTTFPYIPPAHDGRNSRHVDPNRPAARASARPGCSLQGTRR